MPENTTDRQAFEEKERSCSCLRAASAAAAAAAVALLPYDSVSVKCVLLSCCCLLPLLTLLRVFFVAGGVRVSTLIIM